MHRVWVGSVGCRLPSAGVGDMWLSLAFVTCPKHKVWLECVPELPKAQCFVSNVCSYIKTGTKTHSF